MAFKGFAVVLVLFAALAVVPPADAMGRPGVAALQVALRMRGLYGGDIDGYKGPLTTAAVKRFQRRNGLAVDGIVGPRTRAKLGRWARPRQGSRLLWQGKRGWDVAAIQFRLAWRGFPSGPIDGWFGARTDTAVRRYQRFKHLFPDGIVGPVTFRALHSRPPRSPIGFGYPIRAGIGDRFGPRGNRFHTGVDFPAHFGAGVFAARSGRVRVARWTAGGYGKLVVIGHRRRMRSFYAHLSRIHVRRGERVGFGDPIGSVGSTGNSTGPHLHFELRRRGAAVNPLPALR